MSKTTWPWAQSDIIASFSMFIVVCACATAAGQVGYVIQWHWRQAARHEVGRV